MINEKGYLYMIDLGTAKFLLKQKNPKGELDISFP